MRKGTTLFTNWELGRSEKRGTTDKQLEEETVVNWLLTIEGGKVRFITLAKRGGEKGAGKQLSTVT